ncbi:MAG TPA: ABC transporter permease [Kineosporiaceae bacterium]
MTAPTRAVPGSSLGDGAPDASAEPSEAGLPALIGVITQRELLAKLRDKTFLGSTAFLLVAVSLSILLPVALNRDNPRISVGTVGARAAAVAAEAARLGHLAAGPADQIARTTAAELPAARLDVRFFPDAAAALDAVRKGTVDAALAPGDAAVGGLEIVADTGVPDQLATLVNAAARDQALHDALRAAGLDGGGADRALAAAASSAPGQRLLHPPATDRAVSVGLATAFAGIFFMASILFGMSIAQSVVEEKQSRVVEILVAAVPVRALLAGKVIANTVLALGQTLLLAAVGTTAAGLVGQTTLIGLILRVGGWFLLFFVLGFTMLASLWAASGAIASRLEDLNGTTIPLQLLLYLPFFAALWVHDPGVWMRVLSYVPFTAPLSMPQRLMIGDAAWWDALLSAGIVVATTAGMVLVAARFYERNVLRTSGRLSWWEAWRG